MCGEFKLRVRNLRLTPFRKSTPTTPILTAHPGEWLRGATIVVNIVLGICGILDSEVSDHKALSEIQTVVLVAIASIRAER